VESNEPKWLNRFLSLFCPDGLIEEIEGDLMQRFNRDIGRNGEKIARKKLMWNTVRFLRLSIILRNKISFPINRHFMIRNYLKIAFRNILKQKSYTTLNVVGLSLGMAASLLILQYVKYERSFDTFHTNAENIYRIQYNVYHNGALNFESAVAVPAITPFLKKNFPEVVEASRILPRTSVMEYESPVRGLIAFQERKMQFAAPEFLKMFDFRLIDGDRATCLEGINKLIISRSAANKYFGDEDPMGKRMSMNGEIPFEVAGIFEDVPENSHIRFDFLLSYATLNAMTENQSETGWGWYDFYSFVQVRPGTDIVQLQAKIDAALERERGEAWKKSSASQEFILRPLLDIHLESKLLYEAEPDEQRDGDSVYALSVIAFFILAIAWVNYINLATARSFNRANEVGVRKVMGAFRQQLIGQFLTESLIMNVIGCALAVIIVRLSWSAFSDLSGWNIPLDFFFTSGFWTIVGGLFVMGTILSGFYPAIVLSSFRPVSVLKGKVMKSGSGNLLRKSLVVFQFTASIFLIVGSLVVYQQLQFMKHQDLGLTINQTMILRGPGATDSTYRSKFESFKTEVQRIPGVTSISSATFIPGDEIYWTSNIRNLSDEAIDNVVISGAAIDEDFIPSYNVRVLAGRNFDKAFPTDVKGVILNEALSKVLKYKQPADAIGKKVVFVGDTLAVVGVVEDFHQMSLKSQVAPLGIIYHHSPRFYAIKMETNNYRSIIDALEGPWETAFGGTPIEYFFLDEFFNRQYEKDDRFGQVFTLFTGLAILIASLGLFGLASFMALQRTREIGIRKVLGSSVSEIVMLLAKGFIQPVVVANLIAWPLAWWVMDRWLQTFPYHISVNPLFMLVAGIIVVVIAFISVSSQTITAAMTKPVETLKYE
jgi:putative ABC transport system permease protein